ncbi:YggS family pyridoxal phosphate-dependent enzyme [Tepidiphilus sp. J10]|uniref:YggS family pyridoxal phosphate-dependent enzyme n=1 Tax=Tepidiphilus sp. J10 TaxID=2502185 RepID=UPI00115D2731|nr:YggS family pyridoxal phosphate-dependent enzyme [Tepidiphilus sp. J10]
MTIVADSSPCEELLCHRLDALRARVAEAEVRAGRPPGSVTIVAVSKTQPPQAVRAAFACGQRVFGENYVQEGVAKVEALADLPLEWHFIGPIQSNKTRAIAEHFAWVHSLDRLKVAERLAAQRPAALGPLQVLLQVNVSGEASKSGVAPAEVPALAQAVASLPGLRLRGLMCIPEPTSDEAVLRARFRTLRCCLEDLRARGLELDVLSMGMSGDFPLAIEEGATHVRLGTAIFGERKKP